MMAGLTEYGFTRKTLQEILTSMKQNLRSKLGEDWNIETGSPEDQFLSVFAEEADQCWQGVEGIYASQTLDGSEGIYLDDVLSQQGVYRKGKTASSGKAIVFSSYNTVSLGSLIPSDSTVSANNNLTYLVQENTTIDSYMSAYIISTNQLSVGIEYTFSIYNTKSPTSTTFTWTPTSETNKDTMLQKLVEYVNETVLDKPTLAYYNPATRTAYLGFNQSTGLPQPFNRGELYVTTTPRVGSLGHTVFLKTDTLGFNPLSPAGLINLSPVYVGYESIINGDDFNSGSDVQTDAEYRLAAINIKESSVAGTNDSIVAGLLRLEGVVDVRVYENPTENFIYDVSGKTITTPYTYNVAVLGGDDSDVAQVILDKSPLNTRRYGTYSANAIDTKGNSIPVNFTRVGYFDVQIEVSYKTKDNSALTEQEKVAISSNINQAIGELIIGDSVPRSLMEAVTFQSVAFSRLSKVSVRLKDLTLTSPAYTTEDLQADYDEKPRVLLDKIEFKRI
ncbi:baseplate [Rheinheimera phage vB_RspM_Barba23S]|uniref:Baseplate n=5 Tax=Barbavirus TaxID=2733095 RepID=A0A4P8N2S2_9CAUD|nr:baseplate [Rheinheimera phage vB_RspM_Barba11S]QCQ61131.1 baseplate [Rheinheimera phage vB_RspM_Barba15A]QCQ62793.1 baseplate [Rheinheimera phage vB_RspM_Barba22S]QCQ63072.1 baseplate [Rheinheimera phage vB_RspM_Barba23S]QCQ64985.1 baseplate [Rheinheimera phage vB_RspM_Barba33A]